MSRSNSTSQASKKSEEEHTFLSSFLSYFSPRKKPRILPFLGSSTQHSSQRHQFDDDDDDYGRKVERDSCVCVRCIMDDVLLYFSSFSVNEGV